MKNFIIDNDLLKRVLKKTGLAVAKKPTLPVLGNLLCKVRPNEVTFLATDLELTIFYTCECKSNEEFDVLLPFDFLSRIISLHSGVPMAIEVKGNNAFVKGPNDIYEINKLAKVKDFPALPDVPSENLIDIDSQAISWLGRAVDTVGDDSVKPALKKVCFDITPSRMTIASTDAQMLFTHKQEIATSFTGKLLISPKIAKAVEGFSSAVLSWNEKNIAFKGGNMVVLATKYDEKYPNYSVIIPDFKVTLSVNRNLFIAALQKSCITSNETKQTTIFLRRSNDKIVLESEDDQAKITSEVPGEYTGTVEKITLNAKKLLVLLGQVEYENLYLHIESDSKPAVITAEVDKDYLSLIVPYKS